MRRHTQAKYVVQEIPPFTFDSLAVPGVSRHFRPHCCQAQPPIACTHAPRRPGVVRTQISRGICYENSVCPSVSPSVKISIIFSTLLSSQINVIINDMSVKWTFFFIESFWCGWLLFPLGFFGFRHGRSKGWYPPIFKRILL